jgi:hypothetical protein
MDGPGGRPAKGAHATLILAKGNCSVGQMPLVCLYTLRGADPALVCGKALAQLAVAPGGMDFGWDPSTSVTWREVENSIQSDKTGGLR